MSIALNLIAFSVCLFWFHKRQNAEMPKLILPVIITYLGAAIFAFLLSLKAQNEYLDGLDHLITGIAFLILFWLWTTVFIIYKGVKTGEKQNLFTDLFQTSLLLIIPLVIWLSIKDASFKIGG